LNLNSAQVRQWLLIGAVFASSLGATLLLWQHEQHNAALDRRTSAEFSLHEIVSRIEQRMLAHEQVLRGVQGLYAASEYVGRDEFQTYVDSLQLNADFAGMEGIGPLPLVTAAQKDAHEALVRKEGFADYAIQPAGDRAVYAPLVQLEPSVRRNQRAYGFDAFSDPVRRAALEQSRDSGSAVVTAKVTRLEETGSAVPAGFVMYLPVYRFGMPVDSVAKRRDNVSGWIVAPFRMSDLMASLYGERLAGVEVRIFDGVEMSDQSLMYDSARQRGGAVDGPPAIVEYLVVAGRSWTMALHFQPGFSTQAAKDKSQIIALGGLGLSSLLALLTWVLLTERTRAVATATRMTEELREAKNHFELIFDASPDGVVISWLEDNKIIDVNGGFTALTGYTRADVIGKSLLDLHLWSDPEDRQHYLNELLDKGSCENLEVLLQRKDGQQVVGIVSAKIVSFKGYPGVVGVIRDITGRKAAEQRIAHMAQHDTLTNLPNRALLGDRLRHAIAHARRHGTRMALMYIDLDRFKPVNDSLGHQVGDLLLKAVARRMQDSVRASDTVARIGGDEFVVLLPAIGDDRDALQVAEKVRAALNEPFRLAGGHVVSISSSTGIAIYPDHATDEIALAKCADDAMYVSKARGRDRVEVFQPV
jgi:diguanylate cyclase (GGDEF)-like protein/PAS domain S-box-containing protein